MNALEDAAGRDPDADSELPPPLAAGDGRFRRRADGVDWRCELCEGWNALELSVCEVCGTPFGAGPTERATPTTSLSPPQLTALSAVAPGAGHLLLGRRAAGALRFVLAVVWGAGGVLLLSGARGSGQPVLPALPLLTGTLVLAATSALDARTIAAGGDDELLAPRALLWLTGAVVVLTAVLVTVGAFSA